MNIMEISDSGLTVQDLPKVASPMNNDPFEQFVDGKPTRLFTLKNENGVTCDITNYGARIVRLWVPDKNGDFGDVVLGFDTLQEYLDTDEIYFGALVGRYANRIAKGEFSLNDKEHTLDVNHGYHHIHGGTNGFHQQVWDAKQLSEYELQLSYFSPDGEEGFPGNLHIQVTYTLLPDNSLKISYLANTDQATPVSLTNHSFFNLAGAGNPSIQDHLLQINATRYTPIDDQQIPLGTIEPVKDTPFDFQVPATIGSRWAMDHPQLESGLGFDHNYAPDGLGLRQVARVEDPKSGRTMEVITNEPGVQFYSGNFLDGQVTGKNGLTYPYRSAFCLETQRFPDSPNQPAFPDCILYPGQSYQSTCIYKFGVKK